MADIAKTAKIVLIADAVTAELNLRTFSQDVTAERGYQPTYELPDLTTLKVTVVPKAMAPSPGGDTRGARRRHYQIDIGIQKKIDPATNNDREQLDALMALVQEIDKDLEEKRLSCGVRDDAMWIGSENVPVFIPEHLEQHRQFTSVLTVTYRATR